MVKPNFFYENEIWKKGYLKVAGLDEVGRGSFAGPLVCGCVVFPSRYSKFLIPNSVRIDDSKKLTRLQRERTSKWIKANALAWGIGIAKVAEINRRGLTKSTASGFRRAISDCNSRLNIRVTYILIDAFYIPYIRGVRIPRKSLRKQSKYKNNSKMVNHKGQQLAIINGDEKSISIAAASIIAKVYRDRLMQNLSKQYKFKKYGWDTNKGYGTKKHIKAIKRFGITRLHRSKFVEKIMETRKKGLDTRISKRC